MSLNLESYLIMANEYEAPANEKERRRVKLRLLELAYVFGGCGVGQTQNRGVTFFMNEPSVAVA